MKIRIAALALLIAAPCHAQEIVDGSKIAPTEQIRLYTLMRSSLKDGFSAKLQNVTSSAPGRFCGSVNAKNSYGAYIGSQEFAADANEGTFVIVPHTGLAPLAHATALQQSLAICPERFAGKQTPFKIHYRDHGKLLVDSTWADSADDAGAKFLAFAKRFRTGPIELVRVEAFK